MATYIGGTKFVDFSSISGNVPMAQGGTGGTDAASARAALGAASTALANTTAAGLVELATTAEANSATSTTLAVTPADLAAYKASLPQDVTTGNIRSLTGSETTMQGLNSPGWYYISSAQMANMTDAPLNIVSAGWFLEVSGTAPNGVDMKQLLHRNTSTSSQDMYVRTVNTSGYSGWHQIVSGLDIPWTNLAYLSGFTAGTATQLRYTIENGVVYITGGATGTFASGSYTQVNSTLLPTAARPTTNAVRGGAMGSVMKPAGFEVNPAGTILLGWNNLGISATQYTAPAWIAFTVAYPQDTV